MNYWSKYIYGQVLYKANSLDVMLQLDNYISIFGHNTVKYIVADKDNTWINTLIFDYINRRDIIFLEGTSYHHQGRAVIELKNKKLNKLIRVLETQTSPNTIQFIINRFCTTENNIHNIYSKVSPNELLFGANNLDIIDLTKLIENKRYYGPTKEYINTLNSLILAHKELHFKGLLVNHNQKQLQYE